MNPRRLFAFATLACLLAGCGGDREQAGKADASKSERVTQSRIPGASSSVTPDNPSGSLDSEGEDALEAAANSADPSASTNPQDEGFQALSQRVFREGDPLAPGARAQASKPASQLTPKSAGDPEKSGYSPSAARARSDSNVRAPVDFQRLAASIREKYELDALQDPAAELQAMLDRFERGDLGVALPLGLFLAYGDDAIADPTRAADFFRIASENGQARGYAELGRLYLTGRGLSEDANAAESLFTQAMAAGDPEGAFLLASGHKLELFSDAEPDSYLALIETAAALGHSSSANALYLRTKQGELSLSDYPQMESWLLRSAEQGEVRGLRNLYSYYAATGQPEKAVRATELAAEIGSLDALFALTSEIEYFGTNDRTARDQLAAAVKPHADQTGSSALRARYFLAFLEAINGNDAAALEFLESAANEDYSKAKVALERYGSGRPLDESIARAGGMSETDAYVERSKTWDKSGPHPPPSILFAREPQYPVELLAEGMPGEVVMELMIDSTGSVSDSRVVSSNHPAFSNAAQLAIKDWTFSRSTSSSDSLPRKIRIPIHFSPTE